MHHHRRHDSRIVGRLAADFVFGNNQFPLNFSSKYFPDCMLRQAKRDNFYLYGYPATDEIQPTILRWSPFRKKVFLVVCL